MNASRTVLVTGATDGLGRALAHRFAADGDTVLLHGRDPGRLAEAAASVEAVPGAGGVRTFLADFAELDQVRRLAAEAARSVDRLDVLVNNAGIGAGEPEGRERRTSVDGHELRFAVNYLAGFLLTEELLPLLRRSAPARVVNVSSLGQQAIDFEDLMLERGYDGGRAYRQSNLAQVMHAMDLAQTTEAEQVAVNAVHPGTYMPTTLVMRELGHSLDTLETGVASVHRLARGPSLAGVSGRFFDRAEEAEAERQAYDPRARAELRRRSLLLTGLAG